MTGSGATETREPKWLFAPAIAVLNRLNYTRKFTLLWLLSAAAITIAVYSLYASLDRVIQPTRREIEGLALIEPLTRTVQPIQLHRGMSTALLSGDGTMRERRVASQGDVDAAFDELEKVLPPDTFMDEALQGMRADWKRLREGGLDLTTEESFTAHVALIERIQAFKLGIADEYGLTMDPEVGTFYLIHTAIRHLPDAMERLGRIRAYGSGILAAGQATERQRLELRILAAELGTALGAFEAGLEKAARHNPGIGDVLAAVSGDIAYSAGQITGLVESDILTGRFATPSSTYLDMATGEIDNSYLRLHGTLLPTIESLLEARIARANKTLLINVGGASLLLLLVVYVSVSLYYAILGNVRKLARAARAFTAGDLDVRVRLDAHDELRWVSDGFNEMAEGFKAMLEARREDDARLRATIETAMDAVVQMDAAGRIIGWNRQAETVFGWTREEALGRPVADTVIPPRRREAHAQGLERFLLTGEESFLNTRIEGTGLHHDGHEFPIELAVAPIRMAGRYEFSAFIRDITGKKEAEDLIWRQANYDTLTGLPNRRMAQDRLDMAIRKAHRAGQRIALMFTDLDKFKEVNDTLGHSMGDTLLVEVARRIGDCVRDTDTVARLGGDEFVVILSEIGGFGAAERSAGSILERLAEPFDLGDVVVHVTASIGITLYPDDSTEVEDLFKYADQAMYLAKSQGRNRFSHFTPAMQEAAQRRMWLINELRGALAAGQFRVYYQPVVELATGRIDKAEALIRWQHPERGLVNPAEFIPLAEETGLIVEIGDWVFREAARQIARWRTRYGATVQVGVNMSPVQFHGPDCACGGWISRLRELGLTGECIVIEITEGLLLDNDSTVIARLHGFHDEGIGISIDDFGTGYSSLAYLKKFDIDFLKIDQSFVRDLETDPEDRALCEAIVVMAHKLGLRVIAEGVETEAQRALLTEAGCDYAQGYLYSRPVPAGEFETLLKPSGG